MTTEQQRIAIAEACGWNYEKREAWPRRRPKRYSYVLQSPDQKLKVLPEFTVAHAPPDCEIIGFKRLPDYLADLNAMYEAEEALRARRYTFALYRDHLLKICNPGYGRVSRRWSDDENENAIHATAAQRAEAFLRTLNLWTEEPAK